jgi:DNA repair protein RecO (recombination protein O)
MSRPAQRVQLARAYVLHQRPFRDTSLIVELYAREHGRMTVFARAARGPRSRFALLQPFRALLLSWSGRGEAPQLAAAENADAGQPRACLPGQLLMSAFYLNELLLTLTTRHDPHPELFDLL